LTFELFELAEFPECPADRLQGPRDGFLLNPAESRWEFYWEIYGNDGNMTGNLLGNIYFYGNEMGNYN
jgi:hypothetical protein